MLTDEQKKILESTRKKDERTRIPGPSGSAPDLSYLLLANVLQNQQGGGSTALLSLLGGKKAAPRRKSFIDKSGHYCFRCQGMGHWSTDEICPKYRKQDEEEK